MIISLDVITDKTPTLPQAVRGSVHVGFVKETQDQLNNDLVWCPCSFCGRHVMVLTYGRGEKCSCGARRFNRKNGEGWKKNGKEWWFC